MIFYMQVWHYKNTCVMIFSDAGLALGLGSGTLIAVPIPEKYAASGELVEGAIHTAVREAE